MAYRFFWEMLQTVAVTIKNKEKRKRQMIRKIVSSLLAVVLTGALLVGCAGSAAEKDAENPETGEDKAEETEIQVFIAAMRSIRK